MNTAPADVTVIGIGADGLPGLGERAQTLLRESVTIVGSTRQLALLDADPQITADRITLPSPLREGLTQLLGAQADRPLTVLASGDPLVSGIGTTVTELVSASGSGRRVVIIPTVSSLALARAELGWSAESTRWLSLVGRDPHTLLRELAPGVRLLLLGSDSGSAAQVAGMVTAAGYPRATITALSQLGTAEQSQVSGPASEFTAATPALTVIAIQVPAVAPEAPVLGWTSGLPDEAFDHDGQLTKRNLRASALAHLSPRPGELLWDVGAGAGSVGIEWCRADARCRAVAIERSPERVARIGRNAAALGVPALQVICGAAPDALAGLPTPAAIFVGGGASPDTLDACWAALAPGGRLVVHGVTVQTEHLLAGRFEALGGDLTRIGIEHAEPLGGYTSFRPARVVTQWAVTKPAQP